MLLDPKWLMTARATQSIRCGGNSWWVPLTHSSNLFILLGFPCLRILQRILCQDLWQPDRVTVASG